MHPSVEEKLRDIKEHPERHKHDFAGLQRCCFVNGALDMRVMRRRARTAGAAVLCLVGRAAAVRGTKL